MELKAHKADLVRELSLAQGIVEKKNTIPILSNIHLKASKGWLGLQATDLEIGIRHGLCRQRVVLSAFQSEDVAGEAKV